MKIGKLHSALLLLFLSPLAAAQNQDAAACDQLLEEGKTAEALARADKAVNAASDNREALLCKGRAHAELKQYNESLAALQSADKLSSQPAEHVIALLLIGNVQKDAGKQAEALASYKQALDAAKDKQDKTLQRLAMNIIGETQIEAGQIQQGLQHYLHAAELAANDSERGESYARVASAYTKLGNHDQAVEYQIKAMLMLERVGERDEYANAGLELGRYYMSTKDYLKAESAVNKVLKFARDNGSAYWEARSNYYLGLAKAEQGQVDAARALLLDAHHNARRIGAASLAGEIGNAMLKLPDK
jgi:tetratricopeptide (TPR) repeat protein